MDKLLHTQKMKSFKKGEIWLTKFHPGTGNELAKYRPALIIRNLDDIDSRFAVIAPLTSAKMKNKHTEFEVQIEQPELNSTSNVLAWYLWIIDVRRLQHKIGVLNTKDTEKVATALSKLKLNSL